MTKFNEKSQHRFTRLEGVNLSLIDLETLSFRNTNCVKFVVSGTIHESTILQAILVLLCEQFGKEIEQNKGTGSTKNIKLAAFDPFIDADGLLRVGGRLRHAKIPDRQKYPILLPSYHHVTDLIIREVHHSLLHAGIQGTLYKIRQRFWLLDGKNQVRRIVRHCITCIRHQPVNLQAKMSDLPRPRVQQNAVLKHVGVDYFGPINIMEKKFRNRVILPAYGCVFICMPTKSVHIEIASDMTTEAFLGSFKRFIGRRGIPSHAYSDHGTNFVGANNKLREIFNLVHSDSFHDTISSYAAKQNIKWHFNPPVTPHFSGIWESAVKSFKHHLKRVIGKKVLTFKQLNTLCIEIESILNSRPISPISSDPNDPLALTPAHFLIGRPLTMLPDHDLTSVPDNRLPAWKFVVKARQDFWKRWHSEYLNELQKRTKWLEGKGEIKVGSVVILMEKSQSNCHWPLGVVIKVYPGSDGVVRVVDVKIRNGIYKRNITDLCPLLENQ
ncbi:uncharacterized protein LOC106644343 [Copidosoma floridanum]|uniref:uncharacterized protein LOC106644343 n=1 Tax=Copidosoma floridanum TaxID=29053 RepID=UPI0006C97D6E|nr:uncharacterized protein LOC106644343 [Copidosoma floridanum]